MKALIIDDEQPCREVIVQLISQYCPLISEVTEAKTVTGAIQKIKSFVPDIIFLDIQLGKQTCFDILNEFNEIAAHIIFVTAYNEYAIKAFEYAAVHYILKPIDHEQLVNAVERCSKLDSKNGNGNLIKAKSFYLKTIQQDYIIVYDDIAYIKADGSYSSIFYQNGSDLYTSKKLGHYDSILPENFLRIHNSIIVNLSYIKEVNTQKNTVTLENGESLPISRRRKSKLKSFL